MPKAASTSELITYTADSSSLPSRGMQPEVSAADVTEAGLKRAQTEVSIQDAKKRELKKLMQLHKQYVTLLARHKQNSKRKTAAAAAAAVKPAPVTSSPVSRGAPTRRARRRRPEHIRTEETMNVGSDRDVTDDAAPVKGTVAVRAGGGGGVKRRRLTSDPDVTLLTPKLPRRSQSVLERGGGDGRGDDVARVLSLAGAGEEEVVMPNEERLMDLNKQYVSKFA